MDRTTIASLYADEPTDTSITVAGWVRSVCLDSRHVFRAS